MGIEQVILVEAAIGFGLCFFAAAMVLVFAVIITRLSSEYYSYI